MPIKNLHFQFLLKLDDNERGKTNAGLCANKDRKCQGHCRYSLSERNTYISVTCSVTSVMLHPYLLIHKLTKLTINNKNCIFLFF